jgi:hypothetical protein
MATELPDDYAPQEVNHLTLGYFAVGGLSLLRELDRVRSGGPLRRDASSIDPLQQLRRSLDVRNFILPVIFDVLDAPACKDWILITLGRGILRLF